MKCNNLNKPTLNIKIQSIQTAIYASMRTHVQIHARNRMHKRLYT